MVLFGRLEKVRQLYISNELRIEEVIANHQHSQFRRSHRIINDFTPQRAPLDLTIIPNSNAIFGNDWSQQAQKSLYPLSIFMRIANENVMHAKSP